MRSDAAFVPAKFCAGIPAEDLPHVFGRFYRADKSRAGASGRSGLGLAISKAIVEAHGSIEATSQLGASATFTVRLPVEPMQEKSAKRIRERFLVQCDGSIQSVLQ